MSIEVLINYILVSAVIVAIPGPNIILTINDSINYGFRNSLMTILGIVSGMAFLFVLSLAGVTSLLAMFSSLFSIIKWVGVCYLLYLGISQIIISFRSNEQTFSSNNSKKNFFSKGFFISISNPKGLIFAGAFFPQFFDKNSGMIHQAVVLVSGFLVISMVIH
ncbi:MAG: LysE family translocator, partial [Proteobacteria bacterium]|nr:LysE family translocator [Pseudomonadota bacterium]